MVRINAGEMPLCNNVHAELGEMEMEEERRLCYVGMTRAKRSLVLSYVSTLQQQMLEPSPFLREIPPRLLERTSAYEMQQARGARARGGVEAGGEEDPDGAPQVRCCQKSPVTQPRYTQKRPESVTTGRRRICPRIRFSPAAFCRDLRSRSGRRCLAIFASGRELPTSRTPLPWSARCVALCAAAGGGGGCGRGGAGNVDGCEHGEYILSFAEKVKALVGERLNRPV